MSSSDGQGKRVLILGAARQGKALTRYLLAQGAQVVLNDAQAREKLDLSDLNDLSPTIEDASTIDAKLTWEAAPALTVVCGGHPLALLEGCDVLFVSGGVPLDLPIVQAARARGIPLSNDAQLFFEVCPAPIIGITGSAGKTTTTTLVGEMLKAAGRKTWVGGNIGNPLIADVAHIQPSDAVVMELSSFQLELMTRSPHIACITNITPNHLDRHGTMEAYIAAKQRILDFQSPADWCVLSADNAVTAALPRRAHTAWFSLRPLASGQQGAWMDDVGMLWVRIGEVHAPICHRSALQLIGEHNVANVLAAAAVSMLAGAPLEVVRRVATTFRGVAHRLQLVAERNGVRWYDDSIATAPERLLAALRCFEGQSVILLCGGRDKHLPWEEAAQRMRAQCKAVVCFGEMAPMVAAHLARAPGKAQWVVVPGLREAVQVANALAQPGDVVLLSPGGTSFDAFKDFAERGDRFQQWVNELP